MSRLEASTVRGRVTGQPQIANETPVALVPVLADLRNAHNGVRVMAILDTLPPHLLKPMLEAIAMRPALYSAAIVAEVLRFVGFKQTCRFYGLTRAVNMFERFAVAQI